jgi:hypothetical protein
MSSRPSDWPIGATVVVAAANAGGLEAALRKVAADGVVVLLTDNADLAPAVAGVLAVEPEALLAGGVSTFDDELGRDLRRWLEAVFPDVVDGVPMAEALWVNLLRKGDFVRRQAQLVFSAHALQWLQPSRVVVAGEAPDPMGHFVEEAVRRGLVREQPPRSGARPWARTARIAVWWARFATSALVRAAIDVRNRRRMDRRLRHLAVRDEKPALWLGVTATFRQPLRQLTPLARELERARIPYGVLFEQAYGVPRQGSSDQDVDEVAVLDGTVERFDARAVGQVVGAATVAQMLPIVVRWLPRSIRFAMAVARRWDALAIGGLPALRERDVPDLMRVVGGDLYRTLDAAAAARRFAQRQPQARLVVWSIACFGEIKAPDVILQQRGVTTVDLMHGYVTEGNLQSSWRTTSTYNLSWTLEQAEWISRLGTNGHHVGGFAPLSTGAPGKRTARPRVLVLSSYMWDPLFPSYAKFARRLADALTPWMQRLGDAIELRARLHPLDDVTRWENQFAPARAPTRTVGTTLAEDLAWADVVITTPSSSAIDALLRGLPVLLHRGPLVEPHTLFATWPPERTFGDADELERRAAPLLAANVDLEPEKLLLRRCFGPSRRPRDVASFLVDLLNGRAESLHRPLEISAR